MPVIQSVAAHTFCAGRFKIYSYRYTCIILCVNFCIAYPGSADNVLTTVSLLEVDYGRNIARVTERCNCWRAIARQHTILYNRAKSAKSVGCKIGDMRSRLRFLNPGIPGCL